MYRVLFVDLAKVRKLNADDGLFNKDIWASGVRMPDLDNALAFADSQRNYDFVVIGPNNQILYASLIQSNQIINNQLGGR